GLRPDAATLGSGASALGRARLWASAVWLLASLRQAGLPSPPRACAAAVSACQASGCWWEASSMLRELQRSCLQIDVSAVSATAGGCETGGGGGLQLAVQLMA
ncbi:unnamed protein product, partial [Polarella glacialis]